MYDLAFCRSGGNWIMWSMSFGSAQALPIAGLAANAAETSLKAAAADPAFLHSFWLLNQVPLARGPAFTEDLRRLRITS